MAFKNILAAVHLSAGPSSALARALAMADEHGATLRVMDASGLYGDTPDRHFAAKVSAAVATVQGGKTPTDVRVEVISEPAHSAAHLAREVGERGLIVMDHASPRLCSLRGGPPSARLLRLCDGPVLITRSPVQGAYRRVLVAIDLTPVAERLVSLASHVSKVGTVEMLHVIRPLHPNPLRDAEVPERILKAYLSRRRLEVYEHLLRLTGVTEVCPKRAAAMVREGDPARHIALHRSHANVDLVVIGKRRRSAAMDLLWCGTAQRVLAWCGGDILVSPHDRADAEASLPLIPATGPSEFATATR